MGAPAHPHNHVRPFRAARALVPVEYQYRLSTLCCYNSPFSRLQIPQLLPFPCSRSARVPSGRSFISFLPRGHGNRCPIFPSRLFPRRSLPLFTSSRRNALHRLIRERAAIIRNEPHELEGRGEQISETTSPCCLPAAAGQVESACVTLRGGTETALRPSNRNR